MLSYNPNTLRWCYHTIFRGLADTYTETCRGFKITFLSILYCNSFYVLCAFLGNVWCIRKLHATQSVKIAKSVTMHIITLSSYSSKGSLVIWLYINFGKINYFPRIGVNVAFCTLTFAYCERRAHKTFAVFINRLLSYRLRIVVLS